MLTESCTSSSSRTFRMAIVGASNAVGKEMVHILEERRFPLAELKLLTPGSSVCERIGFCGEELMVEALHTDWFRGMDLVISTDEEPASIDNAALVTQAGCVMIDATPAYRIDPDVPLVVPETNPEEIARFTTKGIVSNPCCSSIQLAMVLKPLQEAAKLRRVVAFGLQPVSAFGQRGVRELEKQCISLFNLRNIESEIFPRQIAFNCLSGTGYDPCEKEQTITRQTRKLLKQPELFLTASNVLVPVFYGQGQMINLELDHPLEVEAVRQILSQAAGLKVIDKPDCDNQPTSLDVIGKDEVMVGCIQKDDSRETCLNIWSVIDNMRKGSALNAIQIAEHLIQEYL